LHSAHHWAASMLQLLDEELPADEDIARLEQVALVSSSQHGHE
jgi:hypothetical protein